MSNWIFKVAEQNIYPDVFGLSYVFDNRHSTRVLAGDSFVYLDKRNGQYAFTGHGMVQRLKPRKPLAGETRLRVHTVFEVQLNDVILYETPVDIKPQTKAGKENRSFLGIDNVLNWGPSVKLIDVDMYTAILDLAYRNGSIKLEAPSPDEYAVPDAWSLSRRRHAQAKFKKIVLDRQDSTCLVCGTQLSAVIDVAHIIPYASDVNNRANPANGIALCAYCHRAFDRSIFEIFSDGHVSVLVQDSVALFLAKNMSPAQRKLLMKGANAEFLEKRNSLRDRHNDQNFL